MAIPNPLQRATHRFLTAHFALPDLKLLCFELGVDWASLDGGEDLRLRALSLVEYFDKTDPCYERLLAQLAIARSRQLEGANELIGEICNFCLQLADSDRWAQAAAILGVLPDTVPLDTVLCPKLDARIEALTRQQAWDRAEAFLERFRETLPHLACIERMRLSQPRYLYEKADAAGARADWDNARQLFEELATKYRGYRDTPERLARLRRWEEWHQKAQAAWEGGRWEQAEAFLTNLAAACPDYKGAQQRLSALQSYAEAARLLKADEYARAGEALAPLKEAAPDFLQVRLSADLERRSRELLDDRRWDDSAALLSAMMSFLPDPSKIEGLLTKAQQPGELYRAGDAHAAAGEWDAARRTFEALVTGFPGYRDAARRLAELEDWKRWYSEADDLWSSSHWDESAELLEKLVAAQPRYRDAQRRLEALRRCQKLAKEGQPLLAGRRALAAPGALERAEQLFGEIEALIPGYGEAPVILRHLAAARAVREKRWAEAFAALAELQAQQPSMIGLADLDALAADVRRLQEVRARVWLAPEHNDGFLRDPVLRWDGAYPYEVFRQARGDVTPASPMKLIMDASWDSQQSGMSRELREAWDTLRSVERRLFADAFLLRVERAGELIEFLADELAARLELPEVESLIARFPQGAPVFLLLLDQRQQAVNLLAAGQRERPAESSLAHQLGLLHLARAEALDLQGKTDDAIVAWRQAIGQWAVTLTDEQYWQAWGQERQGCYSLSVLPGQLEGLRQQLEAELIRRIGAAADRQARNGQPAGAESYRQLQTEFQAELAAVRLLRTPALGGIPTEARGRVCCGPALLEAWEAGDALARLSAQLTEQPGDISAQLLGAPDEACTRRLRWYFSSLRFPAVLIEAPQPDAGRALDLLRSIRGVVEDWPYRALARPHEIAQEDTWRLMAEARLRMAEARLARREGWDLRAIRSDWQTALELARRMEGDEQGWAAEAIRTAALAQSQALAREARTENEIEYLGRAISLCELAITLTGEERRLTLRLGDLLSARGIRKANSDDHAGAVEDLGRACKIIADIERAGVPVPYSDHSRDQYAVALAFLARDVVASDRGRATSLLDQASALVAEGLRNKPDYRKYRTTEGLIEDVRADIEGRTPPSLAKDPWAALDALIGPQTAGHSASALLAEASSLRRSGDLEGALARLEQAWQATPADRDVQDELLAVLAEHADRLVAAGGDQAHVSLLEQWRSRFAGHETMARQLDFLRWGPIVRRQLDQTDLKYRYGTRQTMLLPFDSPYIGTMMLRLVVEGDAVCLHGPLPPVRGADESAVLGDLLQATGEMMLCKVANPDSIGLTLTSRAPVRFLNPAWLEHWVRGMARLADIQPAFLRNPGQVQAHFRAQREILRLMNPSRRDSRALLERLLELGPARGCTCQRLEDQRALLKLPAGDVTVSANDEGLRLCLELGYLKPAADRAAQFRRLVAANNRLGLGKVSLSDQGRLQLMCELPDLDDEGLDEALRIFEQHTGSLKQEFAERS